MRYGKLIFMALSLVAAPALAQDEGPSYDKGPVWNFGQIQTVDGHFEDYMKWLAGPWKEQQEALKKAGYISDYKVLLVTDPRKGEPDIILATEYPNMAAFDRSTDEEFAMGQKIWGSMSQANKEQAARSEIRTVQGDMMLREVTLK
ncbi:hypothetical protein [Novosphingobium malaysiense]|uniref:hypothetical protein n=1 Tax=Novosphingobium malaysiense TaxID=1348853 RepID=UPI00068BBA6D|nr:hypothetical protein [Novosphingobium malaysiense]